MDQVSQRKTRNYARIWRCLYSRGHMRTEQWKLKFLAAMLYPRNSKEKRDGLPPNTLTLQRHLCNRCSDRTFNFFKEGNS